jgi:hypothetical protein
VSWFPDCVAWTQRAGYEGIYRRVKQSGVRSAISSRRSGYRTLVPVQVIGLAIAITEDELKFARACTSAVIAAESKESYMMLSESHSIDSPRS